MNHMLTGFMLLWSSGLQAGAKSDSSELSNFRLVGGATRCVGHLEFKVHNDWRPVDDSAFDWNLRTTATVCKQLDCGSAVSAKIKNSHPRRHVWRLNASSLQPKSAQTEHKSMSPEYSHSSVEITCSESVRLVDGDTVCSGRVEVRANQTWSTVCEGDFGWQDAQVVCRELGCGAPPQPQRALCENTQAPERTRENDSSLLGCDSHEAARNACSPVRLTCSEPDIFRLVGRRSRCTGRLEMKSQDNWTPVDGSPYAADLVCRQLRCGSLVSARKKNIEPQTLWGILSSTAEFGPALREQVSTRPWYSSSSLEIFCSDLLLKPMISITPRWVYEFYPFEVRCYIKQHYPGGLFQLIFGDSNITHTTHNRIQKASNDVSHFLFPSANHSHQGNYRCVYRVHVFSHTYSSESQTLSLSVTASPIAFIIRLAGLLLILASFLYVLYAHREATEGQKPGGQENIELDYYNVGASAAEAGQSDVAGAQGIDL